MKKWFLAVFAVCAAAGLAYWLRRPLSTQPPARLDAAPGQTESVPAPIAGSTPFPPDPKWHPNLGASNPPQVLSPRLAGAPAPKSIATVPALAPASVPVAEAPSGIPPAILLENMRTTVRQYGLMFGGNPVGTNPEITKALRGDNPKQVNFLGSDGNRVDEKGELVDAWGTPYFFHQLSGMEMEVRSAGPDRILWTDDDLVIK